MARKDSSGKKEPGRLKQMWQVFQMTRRYDSKAVWYLLVAFLVPVVAGVVLGYLLGDGNVLTLILWIVAGVLAGVLLSLIILGRRAERAAYAQINGQAGAVGAVLRSSLKRGWRGDESPIAVNGRTHDAVYRAVGRGGVVLISEGPQSRTTRMLDEERRKIARIVPNVTVTAISVGPDKDSVPLRKISRKLAKIKPSLTRPEVDAVYKRLTSLGTQMPIPKGIDPYKVKPQRAR